MCLVGTILSLSLQAFAEDKHKDAFMIAEMEWSDQGVTKATRLFFPHSYNLDAKYQSVLLMYELGNVLARIGLDHFNRSTFKNMKWH